MCANVKNCTKELSLINGGRVFVKLEIDGKLGECALSMRYRSILLPDLWLKGYYLNDLKVVTVADLGTSLSTILRS